MESTAPSGIISAGPPILKNVFQKTSKLKKEYQLFVFIS